MRKLFLLFGISTVLIQCAPSFAQGVNPYNSPYLTYVNRNTAASPYTIKATDDVVDCNSFNQSLTLPAASARGKRPLFIRKGSASFSPLCTIIRAGSDTIRGSATNYVLNTQNETVKLLPIGSDWVVLEHYAVTTPTAYTPTLDGISATNINFVWWRNGPNIFIFGSFTATSPAAVAAGISAPSLTLSALANPSLFQIVGRGYADNATAVVKNITLITQAGTSGLLISLENTASTTSPFAFQNGNVVYISGAKYSVTASYPIQTWEP